MRCGFDRFLRDDSNFVFVRLLRSSGGKLRRCRFGGGHLDGHLGLQAGGFGRSVGQFLGVDLGAGEATDHRTDHGQQQQQEDATHHRCVHDDLVVFVFVPRHIVGVHLGFKLGGHNGHHVTTFFVEAHCAFDQLVQACDFFFGVRNRGGWCRAIGRFFNFGAGRNRTLVDEHTHTDFGDHAHGVFGVAHRTVEFVVFGAACGHLHAFFAHALQGVSIGLRGRLWVGRCGWRVRQRARNTNRITEGVAVFHKQF